MMCYNEIGPTGCVNTPPALTATFLSKRIVMAESSLPKTCAAAKAAGLPFFYTGEPCKYGHLAVRRTSDRKCVGCDKRRSDAQWARDREGRLASAQRWKDANRPHIAAYMHEYNTANAERISEAKKRCYYAKHEQYRLRQRAYWHAHKVEHIEKNRQWIVANRDKARAYSLKWARENPEYFAFRHARARHATPAWLADDDRASMLALYAEARRVSDETGIKHEVDHIVPLLGENVCGLHVPWNLQILTQFENRSKGNKHAD